VKVLTHRHHTFYNPCLHLDFTPADSPMLLFEGTYTREFSSDPFATPRHDYNQILYRLDLDDPRLRPAQEPVQGRGGPIPSTRIDASGSADGLPNPVRPD
jgi:hypothetical protein